MNKLKKIFSSMLIITMATIVSMPVSVHAENTTKSTKNTKEKAVTEKTTNKNNTQSLENTKEKTITNIKEIKEYCNQHKISYIEDGKKVSKIVISQKFENNKTEKQSKESKKARAIGDLYEEVYPIQWTGSEYCAIAKGKGPSTLGLNTSYTESATVSASFSYSASDLSATVGFDVTESFCINPVYSIELEKNQKGTIYAYPIYEGSFFKKTNLLTGNVKYGKAYRPTGTEYDQVVREIE